MKQPTTSLLAAFGFLLCVQQAWALPILTPVYQDIDMYQRVNAQGQLVLGVALNAANPFQSGIFDIRAGHGDATPSVTIVGNPNNANAYLNAGTTYHDILGFVPGGEEKILSAYAYFYFRNAMDATDTLTIDLKGFLGESLDGQGTVRFILGGSLDGGALDVLSDHGNLSYTVQRDSGSFYLDYAQLQVVSTANASPVPDRGTTAGLLGGAFLLVASLGRWLRPR